MLRRTGYACQVQVVDLGEVAARQVRREINQVNPVEHQRREGLAHLQGAQMRQQPVTDQRPGTAGRLAQWGCRTGRVCPVVEGLAQFVVLAHVIVEDVLNGRRYIDLEAEAPAHPVVAQLGLHDGPERHEIALQGNQGMGWSHPGIVQERVGCA
ncbi:hypothetical protein D3C79_732210 [compost metagenome]